MTDTLLFESHAPVDSDVVSVRIDKEDLALVILAHKIKPIKITASDRQIAFYFPKVEAEPIMKRMLANEPVMVDFHLVMQAQEAWRNAIVSLKSLRSK